MMGNSPLMTWVGVAGFEPAASSSRSQVCRSTRRRFLWAGLLRLSMVVRGSPWMNVVIVTQLVTRAARGTPTPGHTVLQVCLPVRPPEPSR